LISDFIKEVKVESNEFINSKKWTRGKLAGKKAMGLSRIHTHWSGYKLHIESGNSPSKENI
jgi:hypothetical protein